MASGRTHAMDSVAIAVAGGAITGAMASPLAGMMVGAGALTGIAMSPDLDLGMSYGRRLLMRQTLAIGMLWLAFWQPYAWLIPHRSWVSHAPVISTVLRLMYLMAPILLGLWWCGIELDWVAWIATGKWAVIGLALSDLAHWARDTA